MKRKRKRKGSWWSEDKTEERISIKTETKDRESKEERQRKSEALKKTIKRMTKVKKPLIGGRKQRRREKGKRRKMDRNVGEGQINETVERKQTIRGRVGRGG